MKKPKSVDYPSDDESIRKARLFLAQERSLTQQARIKCLIRTLLELVPENLVWVELETITYSFNVLMGNDASHLVHSSQVMKVLSDMGFTVRKNKGFGRGTYVLVTHVLLDFYTEHYKNKGT